MVYAESYYYHNSDVQRRCADVKKKNSRILRIRVR